MSLLNWVGTVGPVGKKEGEKVGKKVGKKILFFQVMSLGRNSVEMKNIIFPSYAPGA